MQAQLMQVCTCSSACCVLVVTYSSERSRLYQSHAKIFATCSLVTVLFMQIKYFLGLSAKRSIHIDRTLRRIIEHLPEFQWKELTMGLSWLAILLVMKQLGKTRRQVTPAERNCFPHNDG